jgi:hypothetical protein
LTKHPTMSGARTHGSLTKDEEVNAAAWAAGRGAVVGASKVCSIQAHATICMLSNQ